MNKASKPLTSLGATKAVFWDRDGVLNHVVLLREDGVRHASPQSLSNLKLLNKAAEVLGKVKILGFLNIIATNQPDISRGKLSWEELNKMHDFIKMELPEITAIYVCPHDNSHNCSCRKPKPGMLLDAAKDYHLDLANCFMVGDRQKDIDAGKNAGVKTILLKTDYNMQATGHDFSVKNLEEILQIIT